MASSVEVTGLRDLVAELKGPMFRDVNKELRQFSRLIANDLKPLVEQGVKASQAPQAEAMSRTVRVKSDRVPVLSVGATNPPLRKWRGRGTAQSNKLRRGSMAHGVVYGPKGGKPETRVDENYYRIPRNTDGGALGRALSDNGRIMREAEQAYARFYLATLKAHGWVAPSLRGWRGRF